MEKRNLSYGSSVIILAFLFVVINTISGCEQAPSFSKNVKDIKFMLKEKKSEIDYENYVNVKMKPSKILFNKTTEEQVLDNKLCNIVYTVIVENISSENIKINLKLFIPDELSSTIVYGATTLGPRKKDVILKPGERINIGMGTLIKHLNNLSEKEKELFDDYKDILYIELLINDKKSYAKISALK
ncbi:hypothetical protein [Thermohalobacter berrensis]|uniref:Uncharacterized protein n=1 Tax=Thermohalobacter berrensis TaxID=99594 RepID=A0A419T130_9FIRM|nr:hypothetical protein [Thermohalobacter berrensis]RKD31264.1 hypothetical protein BET03_03815 [Thermohalobacter berrensis]